MEIHGQILLSTPRRDGSRILFTIELDGTPIPCAISRGALEELSGSRHLRDDLLARAFAQSGERIAGIAAAIFKDRPESASGTINIWADDIHNPLSAPAAAPAQVNEP